MKQHTIPKPLVTVTGDVSLEDCEIQALNDWVDALHSAANKLESIFAVGGGFCSGETIRDTLLTVRAAIDKAEGKVQV